MNPLDLTKLSPLMELSAGKPEIRIGLIDGPVAMGHSDFVERNIIKVPGKAPGFCTNLSSHACSHGTFVAGILCSKRRSVAPAICPGCTLFVKSVFTEKILENGKVPSTTPEELALAIIETVDAGVHIINLSVALVYPTLKGNCALEGAVNYAAKRGVIIVAAAGNQNAIGSSVITRHPWVVPVVACNGQGIPMQESNLGISIGRQGLLAPGDAITSLGVDGKSLTLSGTSAATPFVTGAVALLWSEFLTARPKDVRWAITQASNQRRTTIVPPLLDAWAAYQVLTLQKKYTAAINLKNNIKIQSMETNHIKEELTNPEPASTNPLPENMVAFSTHEETPCPTCASKTAALPESYVYALGKVEARFPRLSVEKEFAQITGRADTAGLTDRETLYKVLSMPQNRYLVREMCWVFSIQGMDTYLLTPRDSADFALLIEAIRPAPEKSDIDVIIGLRGPNAPLGLCGLSIPIVLCHHLYSFNKNALIKAIPKPKEIAAAQFGSASEELFDRIMQMTDNSGVTDEHRSLNYLAVRYPAIYAKTAEEFACDFSLTGVDVRPSILSSARKIVEVIFAYTNRNTDFTEKFYVRVDVTEEFPFLVTKLSPYYDR